MILSGGDPLYTPNITLGGLAVLPNVKVLRIGTRFPVQSPASLATEPLRSLLSTIKDIRKLKSVYVQLHVNHVSELTVDARSALSAIGATGAIMVSQTVFLKGVNDNDETLGALFSELYYAGIIPYYLYRCDYVRGLERFVCEMEREKAIVSKLTARLSGLAMPTYIVDVSGRGKIPVPLDFWPDASTDKCIDFDGNEVTF